MTTCDFTKHRPRPTILAPGAAERLWQERQAALAAAAESDARSAGEGDRDARARDRAYARAEAIEAELAAAVAPDTPGLQAQLQALRWFIDNGSLWADGTDRRLLDRALEGLARLQPGTGEAAG